MTKNSPKSPLISYINGPSFLKSVKYEKPTYFGLGNFVSILYGIDEAEISSNFFKAPF